MNNIINQEFLVDISSSGRERPWRDKKMKNHLLSLAYDQFNLKKAMRLRDCASWIEFSVQNNGDKRLTNANFCRVRLCPMCSWRRGLKIFSHTTAIMNGMKSERDYSYIFLTLTVKNCDADDLDNVIDSMMKAWNRFMGYKSIKQSVKGWFRGLEITHDVNQFITKDMWHGDSKKKMNSRSGYYKKLGLHIEDLNPSYDTFHPHFHCVFAVNKNYFNNKEYIKHEEWTSFWEKAMKLDYVPVVNVKKVKGDTLKAVAEAAKYVVKDEDYIIPDDWDLTVQTVKLLDNVLDHRRLVAYGGKFKDWHKKLNLDDEMDGNLINIGDEVKEDTSTEKFYYSWNVGYSQYMRS